MRDVIERGENERDLKEWKKAEMAGLRREGEREQEAERQRHRETEDKETEGRRMGCLEGIREEGAKENMDV